MPYSFQKEVSVKDCCKVDSNLTEPNPKVPNWTKFVCKVCGARHTILSVELGKLASIFK